MTAQVSNQQGAASPAQAQTVAELRAELEAVMTERFNVTSLLVGSEPSMAEYAALTKRLAVLDEKLRFTEFRLRQREAELQATAMQPPTEATGFVLPHIPNEYVFLAGLFLVVAILPLSVAFARRIWKRGTPDVALSAELETRFEKLQNTVDATAIEVERISEGQRFVTALVSDQVARIGAAAATPVPELPRESRRHVTPH